MVTVSFFCIIITSLNNTRIITRVLFSVKGMKLLLHGRTPLINRTAFCVGCISLVQVSRFAAGLLSETRIDILQYCGVPYKKGTTDFLDKVYSHYTSPNTTTY